MKISLINATIVEGNGGNGEITGLSVRGEALPEECSQIEAIIKRYLPWNIRNLPPRVKTVSEVSKNSVETTRNKTWWGYPLRYFALPFFPHYYVSLDTKGESQFRLYVGIMPASKQYGLLRDLVGELRPEMDEKAQETYNTIDRLAGSA